MRNKIIYSLALLVLIIAFKMSSSVFDPTVVSSVISSQDIVLIPNVPHIHQKKDFCGEAVTAMFLQRLGYDVDQDDIFNMSSIDPVEGRGMYTKELATTLKKIGFRTGPVWNWIKVAAQKKELDKHWQAILSDLNNGIPSIVCMRYSTAPTTTEHFRLILGYDKKKDEVIYHEPALADGRYLRKKREEFLSLWPLKYKKTEWLLIRLRLEKGRMSVTKTPPGISNAALVQKVMEVKGIMPQGFEVFVQKPFVVISDGPHEAILKRYVNGTIKLGINALKAKFFKNDPPNVLSIWLFKDDNSYRKHTKEIFGDTPSTPYGYVSEKDQALIMNIATGGGTLMHEMFHAFIGANFPECPTWFNEGYASLYEQSSFNDNNIVGYTNWRLPYLQESIREGQILSFERLCTQTDYQFYNEDQGNNYGQARYLALYLQTEGLLVKYYNAFYENRKKDPSGYKTLKEVLGEQDMAAFQKKWEKWVLSLKFPPSYLPKKK